MKNENTSNQLRRAAVAWLVYSVGMIFFCISSESNVGVFLGRTGTGAILLSAALGCTALHGNPDFSSARAAFIAVIITGLLSIALPAISSATALAYISDLFSCLMQLCVLFSGCTELLAALQLLKKSKGKAAAEQCLKRLKRFLLFLTASVVLKLLSSTLGTISTMVSLALFIALCSGLLGIISGILMFRYLRKCAGEI